MENCLFCKIIKKEIPAEIIYEDNTTLAFLDINPVSVGHTLLIPKEHHMWMQETPDEIISETFIVAKKLMLVLKENLSADYINVNIEGKEVPHFHIHLIPRYFDENVVKWEHVKYKDGEMKQTAGDIKNSFE